MDGCRPTAYSGSIRRLLVAGECSLEPFDPSAQADPVAPQTFEDRGDLRVADNRRAEDETAFGRTYRNTTGDGGEFIFAAKELCVRQTAERVS